jgi:hypothetical protein
VKLRNVAKKRISGDVRLAYARKFGWIAIKPVAMKTTVLDCERMDTMFHTRITTRTDNTALNILALKTEGPDMANKADRV